MDKHLRRVLRSEFGLRIKELMPKYVKCKPIASPQIADCYADNSSGRLTTFLALVISTLHNDFTIELAWNLRDEFPIGLGCMRPIDYPESTSSKDLPVDDAFRCRLAALLNPFRDKWWPVTSQSQIGDMNLSEIFALDPRPKTPDRLSESLDDVVEMIKRIAFPYFDRIRSEYGSK